MLDKKNTRVLVEKPKEQNIVAGKWILNLEEGIEEVKNPSCKARLKFKVEVVTYHDNLGKESEGMTFFLKESLYGFGEFLRKWDL